VPSCTATITSAVVHTAWPREPESGTRMTEPASYALSLLAVAEEAPTEHVSPYLVGISSFLVFVVLLAATLLFNRDR
jgi:hypothetical protein